MGDFHPALNENPWGVIRRYLFSPWGEGSYQNEGLLNRSFKDFISDLELLSFLIIKAIHLVW